MKIPVANVVVALRPDERVGRPYDDADTCEHLSSILSERAKELRVLDWGYADPPRLGGEHRRAWFERGDADGQGRSEG